MKKGILFDVLYSSKLLGVVYIDHDKFLAVNYETNSFGWVRAIDCKYCNSKEKVVD